MNDIASIKRSSKTPINTYPNSCDDISTDSQTENKYKSQDTSNALTDPIYEQVSKISQEIKTQIEIIAQEIWKEERNNVIENIAKILEINPEELEAQLLNIRAKRGRPRKKVSI